LSSRSVLAKKAVATENLRRLKRMPHFAWGRRRPAPLRTAAEPAAFAAMVQASTICADSAFCIDLVKVNKSLKGINRRMALLLLPSL